MRIAFLAHYPAASLLPDSAIKPKYRGTEHSAPWVRLLAEALSTMPDTTVHVFSDSRAVTRRQSAIRNHVHYTFLPKWEPIRSDPFHLFLPAVCRYRSRLVEYNPDVVIGFGAESGNGFAACRLPWPRVVFLQGIMSKCLPYFPIPFPARWIWLAMERSLPRRADGLIAETRFARDWALNMNPSARVEVIPHVADFFFSGIPVKATTGPVIVSVGSLIPLKGHDTVIRAFAGCGIQDAQLVLIGDGPARSSLESLATSLGVAKRVQFRGRLDRSLVRTALNEARIFVLASHMDTSPNSITEAHSAGLPVIASNVGGISDMVHEGVDGLLFPAGDHAALAARLQELLPDQERCRSMGKAGQSKVFNINNPSGVACSVREFLAEIIHIAKASRS
jgi:glycosyltransferase involved in cell wall biosynthesis